jgi:hypothetical protein
VDDDNCETSDMTDWVLLAYRLPREPSTPRTAVWRKLRRLGAASLVDGLVALPDTAANREQLEWLADEVEAAAGEAWVWLARAGTRAQDRALRERMSAEVRAEYDRLVAEARDARTAAPATRRRTRDRLRRELTRIRRRDHFPGRAAELAEAAVRALEAADDAAGVRA